jgi:purine nucleoside phosphorylase
MTKINKNIFSSYKIISELFIKDIPHFPFNTISGNQGKFHLCKKEGNTVLIIESGNYDGFSNEESVYLSLILKNLGIHLVVVSLFGDYSDPDDSSSEKSDLYLLNDIFNNTWTTKPYNILYQLVENKNLNQSEKPLMDENVFKKYVSGLEGAGYMSYSGALYLTKCEKYVSNFFGNKLVGSYDPSIFFSLNYLSIDYVPICMVSKYEENKELTSKFEKIHDEIMDNFKNQKYEEEKVVVQSFTVNPNRKKLLPENVVETFEFLKSKFCLEEYPDSLIIDFNLNLSFEKSQKISAVKFSDIPNVRYYGKDNTPELSIIKLENGKLVFALLNLAKEYEFSDAIDLSVFIRVIINS